MAQMLAMGVRLVSGKTVLQAKKTSTGPRWISNPRAVHRCKRAKPLHHLPRPLYDLISFYAYYTPYTPYNTVTSFYSEKRQRQSKFSVTNIRKNQP